MSRMMRAGDFNFRIEADKKNSNAKTLSFRIIPDIDQRIPLDRFIRILKEQFEDDSLTLRICKTIYDELSKREFYGTVIMYLPETGTGEVTTMMLDICMMDQMGMLPDDKITHCRFDLLHFPKDIEDEAQILHHSIGKTLHAIHCLLIKRYELGGKMKGIEG